MRAIARGEYAVNGFRNRDLRQILNAPAASKDEDHKRAAKVTRQLRLLRAHALIQKVPRTHRYQLTDKGRTVITALSHAAQCSIKRLSEIAA